MKIYSLVAAILVCLALPAWAQTGAGASPESQYLAIWELVNKADRANDAGTFAPAIADDKAAQIALRNLQTDFPTWNTNTVALLLDYVGSKLNSLTAKAPDAAATPASPLPTPSAVSRQNLPLTAADTGDLTNQLRAAWDQLRVAAADRTLLEAKLREALASQPAAVDPRELARAEERIRAVMKENDLLKNALEEEKSSPRASSAELERLRRSLADTNRKLQTQTDAAVLLLAETNTKLDKQSTLAANLARERDLLQRRMEMIDTNSTSRLVTENADLRRQLQSSSAPGANLASLTRQMQETQTKLAKTQSERDALALEKNSLEKRLADAQKQVAASPQTATGTTSADARRLKELQRERDDLQKKLTAANAELSTRGTSKASPSSLRKLNDQVLALRAKLDVYETKAVPYSREELALFKKPEPPLIIADSKTTKAKPSPSNAAISSESQRPLAPSQVDKTEVISTRTSPRDEQDIRSLCNLATQQIATNNFAAGEETIQKALALNGNDSASLGVLGYIRFNQTNYDEALDLFSKATKLKPQDAGLQNLLGMALIEKGMRSQAETAFRKALQINPKLPDAHRNLAAVYLMENPPMLGLARWHYQKALDAGHPRVPDLERRLGLPEQ